MGDKPYTKTANRVFLDFFLMVQQLSKNLSEKRSHFDRTVGTNLKEDTYRNMLTKNYAFMEKHCGFIVEKLCCFGPFTGSKGDYTDVWMIEITIK